MQRRGIDLENPLGSTRSLLRTHYFVDDPSVFFWIDGRLMTPDVIVELETRLSAIEPRVMREGPPSEESRALERELERIKRKLRRYHADMHRPNNIHKALGVLEAAGDKIKSPDKETLGGMRIFLARMLEEYPLLKGNDRIGYPHIVVATIKIILELAVELLEKETKI